MSFVPGRPVVRRYVRAGVVTWAQSCRVVSDDVHGTVLWLPLGSGFACRESPEGERLREVPVDEYARSRLVLDRWHHTSCLILVPPGSAHSVWWIFRDGAFDGWYVNLEQPSWRWSNPLASGVDTHDHGLDIVVAADRSWRWKDEDDFAEYTDEPGYWTRADAARIRAEGHRVLDRLAARQFPFDGRWCDYRPPTDWDPLPLPDSGWQQPGDQSIRDGSFSGVDRRRTRLSS